MKLTKSITPILSCAALLSVGNFAFAGNGTCEKSKQSCKTEGKSSCTKSSCDGLPALAAGHTRVKYKVSGMTCGGCSSAITKKLAALDGVKVDGVCHKSGCATLQFDPKKVQKDTIAKTISAGKFKVTAERVTVPVTGMTCTKCSDKITTALSGLAGVKVKKICHKSGKAVVDLDLEKGDQAAVVKAITDAGFKVNQG